MNEIVFEITQEADGGFCAECLTESIFTQGDTWEELRANVKEAVEAFYFDSPKPVGVRLHLVRDEVFALLEIREDQPIRQPHHLADGGANATPRRSSCAQSVADHKRTTQRAILDSL
jgi:hypothetical protein